MGKRLADLRIILVNEDSPVSCLFIGGRARQFMSAGQVVGLLWNEILPLLQNRRHSLERGRPNELEKRLAVIRDTFLRSHRTRN